MMERLTASSEFTSGESDWTHTHSVSKIMEFHLVPNVPLLRIEFPGGESIRMHCGKQQAQKRGEALGSAGRGFFTRYTNRCLLTQRQKTL